MDITKETEENWANERIGNMVKFKPPAENVGILKDRCSSYAPIRDTYYINVIDLIEFPEGETIRFGYYRQHTWGGQTSLTERIDYLTELFVKTMVEKDWFYNFIENSYKKAVNIRLKKEDDVKETD